ncbi:MAG: DUF4835 family protein [Nitrososphaera sp.]|nr:DUF4835 family protein [Nitrososphaera sp.]MCI0708418.1 DUF4835 family protein [Ignavibacteriota bacterium]
MFSILLIAILSLIIVPFSMGQELLCEVTVNFDRLSSALQVNLTDFKSDVERYINGNKWTTEDFGDEKIRCAISIVFQTGTEEGRYTAQVFVGSQRPYYIENDPTDKLSPIVRIIDDNWQFTYLPNQRMFQDDFQFDPLTDFLDFYAYLIIGLDMETYTELSGTNYFQKALNICSQGGASSFAAGWIQVSGSYSRFNIIDEIMNARYQPFRYSFHSYHFNGIDLVFTERIDGLNTMLREIEAIGELRKRQDPRSNLVKAFFDAKYQEIAEAFLPYPDRSVYQRLATADPSHQSTYQEYSARP